MNKRMCLAVVAVMLLAGIVAASAAGTESPSDTLKLTSAQEKIAWRDLTMPSFNLTASAGFNAVIGATVPHSIVTAPVPMKAASDIPALKPYHFHRSTTRAADR